MSDRLTHDEVVARLGELPQWCEAGRRLHARYDLADVPAAVAFVAAVMEAAEEQDHHPDVDLRWRRVRLQLWSHDVGGITPRDLRLAATVEQLAAQHGATSLGGARALTEVGIDTTDVARVTGFWQAALGYEPVDGSGTVLRDPEGNGPDVWFQETDGAATGRNRLHVDVRVPQAEVAARREAVEAAGGVETPSSNPPSWFVYADADGNEVCLCTAAGRD